MAGKLPFWPSKEEIIESAIAVGWEHRIIREKDVLIKQNPEVFVILQDIKFGSRYLHAVGLQYARRLGLEIEDE